jgi:hypothetical protein
MFSQSLPSPQKLFPKNTLVWGRFFSLGKSEGICGDISGLSRPNLEKKTGHLGFFGIQDNPRQSSKIHRSKQCPK